MIACAMRSRCYVAMLIGAALAMTCALGASASGASGEVAVHVQRRLGIFGSGYFRVNF